MYSTKGFILRNYNIGENDKGYVIYTENYGKKIFFAKGARKIQSKLSPHLAEFAEVNLDFIKGRNSDKLTGAQLEKSFKFIKNDLRKITVANFAVDVFDNLIKLEHPDKDVYNLLREIFKILDKEENIKRCYFSANIFIWKLLILLGYKPELNKCAKCGCDFTEKIYLDAMKCELFCGKCYGAGRSEELYDNRENARLGKPHISPLLLPAQACKGDGVISRSSLKYLKGNPPSAVDCDEIIIIIQKFIRLHLEKVLKSEAWIEKLF
ncbi:MAG: DNA repair protein RecO [bacterium]